MRWTTALKSNAGLTLVEVLIAMAIVFIIFLGITNSGLVVLDQNIKNSQRDEAVQVADNVVQKYRDMPFDNVVVGVTPTYYIFRQVRGMNQRYSVVDNIASIDPTNRQVAVTVGWTRTEYGRPKSYTHQIVTIVRQR